MHKSDTRFLTLMLRNTSVFKAMRYAVSLSHTKNTTSGVNTTCGYSITKWHYACTCIVHCSIDFQMYLSPTVPYGL
jgi:hypothetical protein